jgi:hypothetical protein
MDPRMRPRVDLCVDVPQEEVLGRLKSRLTAKAELQGTVLSRHVELLVAPTERHTWSPWLSIDVDTLEGRARSCRIHGKFGPHPHVWTLFVAVYALLTCGAIAGAMYGMAQLTLGVSPWALWALPVMGVLALGTYLLALTGKKLGGEQMSQMCAFMHEAVPELADGKSPEELAANACSEQEATLPQVNEA